MRIFSQITFFCDPTKYYIHTLIEYNTFERLSIGV